jgi:hypothetical protein
MCPLCAAALLIAGAASAGGLASLVKKGLSFRKVRKSSK